MIKQKNKKMNDFYNMRYDTTFLRKYFKRIRVNDKIIIVKSNFNIIF